VSRLRLGTSLALAAAVLTASAMPARAQDISEESDLTAVIALNGQPCGRVVSASKRGDNDYVATCSDGNRYRVYIRDGRVIVEKTN
jgi:hypothetical protein